MKNFLETNYDSFISKVKNHISSEVKMGRYADFWSRLDIQLLILPQLIGVIHNETGIDSDDCDSLIERSKQPRTYWVRKGKVEDKEPKIGVGDSIEKESSEVTGCKNISVAHKYKLKWFIRKTKNMRFVEENIARALLDILVQKVDSLDVFAEDPAESCLKSLSFMEQYYEEIKNRFQLPDKNLISQISYRTYENRENNGIMCFVPKELRDQLKKVVVFSDGSIDEEGFKEDNEDNMRKLLEISKPGFEGDVSRWLLFDPKGKQCWGVILEKDIKKQNYLSVHFKGAGKWEVRHKNKVVLVCDHKKMFMEENSRNVAGQEKLLETVENASFFTKLIQYLEKQRHGALVIVAPDAESETDRLCNGFCRGTRVENNGDDVPKEDMISMISGFCSVDGAVFVDLKGNCWGYGVILDGEAKTKAARGRGARYNSASNYIERSERYAIVVSEDKDKGIEVLDPEGNYKKVMK